MDSIKFYNRYTDQLEDEQVYGEGFLRWIYGNPLGLLTLHMLVKRACFSKLYGKLMDKPSSREKIAPFIEQYGLDVNDFLDAPDSYEHFNAFFYRKLKPEARPIADSEVVFPADGRHLAFQDASQIEGVFVKGQKFDLARLLGSDELGEKYAGGSVILSRLCPVDYHRFHFPVAGVAGEAKLINGDYFSVSPIALGRRLGYLWENKRVLTEVQTENLGKVLILEVGATCVGTIHQTYKPGPVEKGQEKGYFAFGGSTTMTFFEPGKIQLASDLSHHSSDQVEVYAKVGDLLAYANL
ncbi:phosphatidylserine decarboxylase [Persicirhabdus sediminis]|uniref:Phosphatidylserine decarboxylase n=1 Tax=Persicirhabdus sediminis TaxID=454144 RepID=A0A8J7MD60_9BACT|nr:phosphatidylserine decarboxylase [Persicirhabdus sediminis]MBK1791589.1 phosphatidylserine decarboxylase [Persicirhabdus sediminis]